MKKILMALLAVIAVTVTASAQEKREFKNHHKKHQHGMMAKNLNFSEDQKKQAKAYREEFRTKMKELNKMDNITVKEMRERKQALLKEQKEKMGSLLTTEQKNKIAQQKAERKAKAGERYAKHLDKMKSTLGLTDEQVAKLKDQRESIHNKMKKIKDNEALSREQKKEKMMALKAEAKEQHKKILTPEQQVKMEEMRKNHMGRSRTK